MKALALAMLALAFGGDEERGYELLKQGKYAEAADALRAAIAKQGQSPELAYNLALALWKSGKADDAETAAEQVSALSDRRLDALRDGILGNLRFERAKQEQKDLQKALQLAEQARDCFERGALHPDAGPELARNLERALALVDELKKKLEEQKKDEQKKDDQKKDEKKKDDKQEPDSRPQSKPESHEQQPESRPESQPGQDQQEPKPEPGKDEQQKKPEQSQPEQKPAQGGDKQEQQQPRNDAPGEHKKAELTPEQTKRVLDQLQRMEEQLAILRAAQKQQRPKVDRDW